MCIYSVVELVIFILMLLELNGSNTKSRRNFFFWIESLILLIVLGFRNKNVGGDTPDYVSFFIGEPSKYGSLYYDNYVLEPGFLILSRGLYFISSDWRWFIFTTSLLSLIPFLYLVKKRRGPVSIPMLSFLLCWELLWLIQTPIRQNMALCLGFIGFLILKSKHISHNYVRFILSLIFFVWSLTTHTTMIVVIPLFMLCYFWHPSLKTMCTTLLLTLVVSIISTSFLSEVLSIFTSLTRDLPYAERMVEHSMNNNNNNNINYVLMSLPTLLVISLLLLSKSKELKSYLVRVLVMGCCMFNVGYAFPLITRVVLGFTLVGAAYCPKGFSFYSKDKTKVYLSLFVILLFLLNFIRHFNYYATFRTKLSTDILPYTFWFE